jgi:hypothetical protein
MIESKDVVLGTLGSSAALAGFDLVFLGIVIAAYQSYAGNAPPSVVRPFRIAGIGLFGTFGISLVTVALSLTWLVLGGPGWLYGFTVGFFALQLVAVFLAAGWTTRMVLWR